jgi:hypothetical protein
VTAERFASRTSVLEAAGRSPIEAVGTALRDHMCSWRAALTQSAPPPRSCQAGQRSDQTASGGLTSRPSTALTEGRWRRSASASSPSLNTYPSNKRYEAAVPVALAFGTRSDDAVRRAGQLT